MFWDLGRKMHRLISKRLNPSKLLNFLILKLFRVQLSLHKLTDDVAQGDVGFLDPGRDVGRHGQYEVGTPGKLPPAAGHT